MNKTFLNYTYDKYMKQGEGKRFAMAGIDDVAITYQEISDILGFKNIENDCMETIISGIANTCVIKLESNDDDRQGCQYIYPYKSIVVNHMTRKVVISFSIDYIIFRENWEVPAYL